MCIQGCWRINSRPFGGSCLESHCLMIFFSRLVPSYLIRNMDLIHWRISRKKSQDKQPILKTTDWWSIVELVRMCHQQFCRAVEALLTFYLIADFINLPRKDWLRFITEGIPDEGKHCSRIIIIEQAFKGSHRH